MEILKRIQDEWGSYRLNRHIHEQLDSGQSLIDRTVEGGFVNRQAVDLHKDGLRVAKVMALFAERETGSTEFTPEEIKSILKDMSPAEVAAVLELQAAKIEETLSRIVNRKD